MKGYENENFLGLTAKVEIKEIYDGRYLDEFNKNISEEEAEKYKQKRKIFTNDLKLMIDNSMNIPKKDVIPGVNIYEKEYPKDVDLFADIRK